MISDDTPLAAERSKPNAVVPRPVVWRGWLEQSGRSIHLVINIATKIISRYFR